MNPDHFKQNPSGRLVQVQHSDGPYWAFIPDPLPPEMPVDTRLSARLEEASHALGELSALGRAMPNPYLLINPFIRREAVLSSRIEGARADIADLYAYEAGQLALPGMEQAHDAIARAKRLQDLHAAWRGRLIQARRSTLALKLMESLFESPVVTIPQARRILHASYPGAQGNVQRLIDAGVLRQQGEASYGKIYVADDILSIISDPGGPSQN